jgi:hypothetical protein
MKQVDVEALTARLIAIHPVLTSKKPTSRREEIELWEEIRSLQGQLADEFGRRNGWRRGKWFSIETLSRNGVRETSADGWHYPDGWPQIDHCYFYRKNRRASALVVHLYDARGPDDERIIAWAKSAGLVASFPDYPSWWLPGRTTIAVYEPMIKEGDNHV